MNIGSMTPAKIYVNHNFPEYASDNRLWQGVPALECSPKGRLFAAWYTGGKTEEPGNVVIVERSEGDGKPFTDGWIVVKHDDPEVRCFDETLWIDPQGHLNLFWAQSHLFFDGRNGVWMSTCENPDAENPIFGTPRRIANGIMLNKPTVTKSGRWLMPCALWTTEFHEATEKHPELADEVLANLYASDDQGKTFFRLGGVDMPDRAYDEHMTIELNDGRLWMLARTRHGIGQAFSVDGGKTWIDIGFSGHSGPNSRFFVRRLKSGRILLINHVNPSNQTSYQEWNVRNNLMAMLSDDEGKTWKGGLMLDTRDGVSYPDGVETSDGRIYIIYDYLRYSAKSFYLAEFTEEDILEGRIVNPNSRLKVKIECT